MRCKECAEFCRLTKSVTSRMEPGSAVKYLDARDLETGQEIGAARSIWPGECNFMKQEKRPHTDEFDPLLSVYPTLD